MWRLLSALVILATLIFNVFAITALLDAWELADTAWREPFHTLGKLYILPVMLLAETVQGPLSALVGERFELPCWWVHVFALYVSSSLAIYAGSLGRSEPQPAGEAVRGGASLLFPLTILTYLSNLVVQGFRNRVVSRFLARHNKTSVLYMSGVAALYAGANVANASVLNGEPPKDQEFGLRNDITCIFDEGDVIDQMRRVMPVS